MKRLWNILSVLAVLNVLAFGGLVGWLVASNRLDASRVHKVKMALATTLEAEKQAHAEAEAKAAEEKALAEAEARLAIPPVPSAQVISASQQQQDVGIQSALRKERELADLRASLLRLQDDLERREGALTDKIAAFEDTKKRFAEIEGAAQFKTALTALEGQKAKDAKAILEALLLQGQGDQVIAYLAAMEETKRAKVLAEFAKTEAPVAADLLERLRTRDGGAAREPGATSVPESGAVDENTAADAGGGGGVGGGGSGGIAGGAGALGGE